MGGATFLPLARYIPSLNSRNILKGWDPPNHCCWPSVVCNMIYFSCRLVVTYCCNVSWLTGCPPLKVTEQCTQVHLTSTTEWYQVVVIVSNHASRVLETFFSSDVARHGAQSLNSLQNKLAPSKKIRSKGCLATGAVMKVKHIFKS